MLAHELRPTGRRVRGRSALELALVGIARIEKPKVIAGLPQWRDQVPPLVHATHWTRSHFDSPRQRPRAKFTIDERKILRQPDGPVALALGGKHHGVSAFCQRLYHAFEVA